MITGRRVTILLAACLLAGCGQEELASEPPPEPKPSHPWELEPTDPELIAGKEIYLAECALCHNEGEEHAPPLTAHEDWSIRAAKGLDVLFDHAINGFIGDEGEMPARGGTDSLTDAEVQNAVRFMLETQKSS